MMSHQNKKENSSSGYRRTPNTECIVCHKPLYRRPSELKKIRHAACMEHRAEAQKISGITDAQKRGLSLGTKKGTNYRKGYKHREESKRKSSESHKAWCAANPEKVKARGAKIRGKLHYNWKGGSSRLNVSIRRMTENRKWMDAVKERDGVCSCGSTLDLESHHIVSLAVLIAENNIKNRNGARKCSALWDLSNGETKCRKCHYKIHGRHYDN